LANALAIKGAQEGIDETARHQSIEPVARVVRRHEVELVVENWPYQRRHRGGSGTAQVGSQDDAHLGLKLLCHAQDRVYGFGLVGNIMV
jgi:hypothetical protein